MKIYKCTVHSRGHPFKDGHTIGDVSYAYAYELPSPYSPGQFQCIGNPIRSVTEEHYTFERLSLWRSLTYLLPRIRREFRWHRWRMFKMIFSNSPTKDPTNER